jgi:hypothetical protein
MLDRLVVPLALMTLLMATAACGATARNASTDSAGNGAGVSRPTAFEAWAVSNGTGAFFKAVGPAGGTGVQRGWPQ